VFLVIWLSVNERELKWSYIRPQNVTGLFLSKSLRSYGDAV